MSKFSKTLLGYLPGPLEDGDSVVPPPPSCDSLRPSRPPRGMRTPSVGVELPDFSQIPDGAPAWMKRARRLVLALEQAIESGGVDTTAVAAAERAFAAYELSGVSDPHIARVAHLAERAHRALHERLSSSLNDAYASCAQVVHQGLPSALKKKTDAGELIDVMKGLRAEADPWKAVVIATSRIFGWEQRAQEHAAQAIRAALDVAGR